MQIAKIYKNHWIYFDWFEENYGKQNTVFLEPIGIKHGYWGFHGGREIRQLFMLQVQSQEFVYMTSFAMRDVIKYRIENDESVEFVKKLKKKKYVSSCNNFL